jgi:DNA-binding XRE family transcriptional regulator
MDVEIPMITGILETDGDLRRIIPMNLGIISMRISIRSPADLGLAIRAVRKSTHVRIDDLAATAGVSKQFTSDAEHGKPTVQFGLVLKLLAELGVPLEVDITEEAARTLATLRSSAPGIPSPPQSKQRA